MRLDKYLKVSRLIKRRTVANEACDNERVSVNGRVVRASYDVKVGDKITIRFGQKELTVEELSARTNYQKHAFMRKFKQIMGVSPYKYIKDYRLSNAYYLLRTGNFTIAEVAEQIGYNNSTSFSHAFKQHFGILHG